MWPPPPRTKTHLWVLKSPVDLVIISGAQVDHDVLVPVEEHDGTGVVELVHLVEVGHLGDVHQVGGGKVLHRVGNLVHQLVHLHAGGVPVVAEPSEAVRDGNYRRSGSFRW